MLEIFREQKKIDYQLEIEAAAVLSQNEIGLIPASIAKDIARISKSGKITAKRIKQLESKSDHDTAALVEALAEKCKKESRPWIHYGLTISFGLKFANWAAEMSTHLERLDEIKKRVLICKTMGVVGTGSLMGKNALKIQERVAKRLSLYPAKVTTQIVPRERYAEYIFQLALLGATLEKIAVEIRNLQRTEIAEVSEHFKKGQMGSSAVPTKRNPIKSERISSLSKLLRSQISISFENIPLWHERDLSNSANERFILPMTSILLDEMLETMTKIIGNLQVNTKRVQKNLHITRGQIFAEFVLEALIKKGVPRFEAYRDVQRVAFDAHKKEIDYLDAIKNDKMISSNLSNKEIESIFVAEKHLGASLAIIDNVYSHVKANAKKFS